MAQSSLVLSLINYFRNSLITRQAYSLGLMVNVWEGIEKSIKAELDAIAYEASAMRDAGHVFNDSNIHQYRRYTSLLGQVNDEIANNSSRFGGIRNNMLSDGLDIGWSQAKQTLNLMGNFAQLPVQAIETYAGMLYAPGSGVVPPLTEVLHNVFGTASEGIANAMINNLAMGQSPMTLANSIADGMGYGLDQMALIFRTEQGRAYNASTQEQYQQSGWVKGYRRLSAKTDRTCLACILDDGRYYPLEEEFGDHPHGLCTLVPVLLNGEEPFWQHGADWLAEQPEDVQRRIMGDARYEAWKAGKPLDSFYRIHKDDAWGTSPQVISLKDLALTPTVSSEPDDLELFNKYSQRWLSGVDADARSQAYNLAMNNKDLHDYLLKEYFGEDIPNFVNVFRVGGINPYEYEEPIFSFFTSLDMAEIYQKRMGVDSISSYTAIIKGVVPSLSGAGEVWVHVDWLDL